MAGFMVCGGAYAMTVRQGQAPDVEAAIVVAVRPPNAQNAA
jgi:hypothetical protein